MSHFWRRTIPLCEPTVVALFWGSAYVSIKFGLLGFSPLTLVTLRFAIAALGFLALYGLRLIPYRRICGRDRFRFALLVALGVPVYHLCLVESETALPASVASLIGQTTAIFALGLSALAKPSVLHSRNLAGVLVASAGTLLVFAGGDFAVGSRVSWLPVMVCFGAPLALAAATLLGKSLVATYGAANLSAQVCIAGGAILGASVLFRPGLIHEMANAPLASWLAVACLALLSTVAAYVLWYHTLTHRTACQAAMFTYLIPLFGIALSWLTLGEVMGPQMVLSCPLIVLGVWLTNVSRERVNPTWSASFFKQRLARSRVSRR